MVFNLEKVANLAKKNGYSDSILRYRLTHIPLNDALEAVKVIGRQRTPDFVIDEENRFVYENFIKWVHADVSMKAIDPVTNQIVPGNVKKGIYIAGPTGSGKSWAMEVMAMYAQICRAKIFPQDCRDAIGLYWPSTLATEVTELWAETGKIETYKKRSILCLQDLGTEPNEMAYMGNRQNVLKALIEHRGDNRCAVTLISSNLHPGTDFFRQYYGDRAQSRIKTMCNFLILGGGDRRK